MSRPLSNPDPWNELFEKLKIQNPRLSNFESGAFLPFKVEAGQNGFNTRIRVLAKVSLGLTGNMAIDYNRFDPAKYISNFGTVTKIPTLRYFGNAGDTVTTAQLLDKMNSLLGTSFSVSGSFPDLAISNFTLPAKEAETTINLQTNTDTAGIFSLRLNSNVSFPLKLTNKGKIISESVLGRNITPIVKADQSLNWGIWPKTLASLAVSQDLILQNIDFTEFFGSEALLQSNVVYHSTLSVGGANYWYSFKPAALEQINKILVSYGLAPLVAGEKHILTSSLTFATLALPDAGYLSYANQTNMSRTMSLLKGKTKFNAWSGALTTTIPMPPQANLQFSACLKVYPRGWSGSTIGENQNESSYTSLDPTKRPMLFHFNIL